MKRRQFILGAAGVAITRAAMGATVKDVLETIKLARRDLSTLRAPFRQERTLSLFKNPVRSRGTLTVAFPDRLRWELAEPDSVTYWMVPEGLFVRTEGKVMRVPQTKRDASLDLAGLEALLLGDPARLAEKNKLRVERNGDEEALIGIAEDDKALVREFRLVFGPDKSCPRKVTLIEGPRDRTEIVFDAPLKNPKLSERELRPVADQPSP